jgi:CBS domain-containing protein
MEAPLHIADVLASKGSASVQTIGPQATLQQLVDLLVEHRIGAAVVSDDDDHVLGIISERDVVRALAGGQSALDAHVGDVMTVDVTVCEPEDDIEDLMRAMTDRRIRHIPVVRDGRLAGMVSIGDAVKARMSDLEFERDQLNTYVRGG